MKGQLGRTYLSAAPQAHATPDFIQAMNSFLWVARAISALNLTAKRGFKLFGPRAGKPS